MYIEAPVTAVALLDPDPLGSTKGLRNSSRALPGAKRRRRLAAEAPRPNAAERTGLAYQGPSVDSFLAPRMDLPSLTAGPDSWRFRVVRNLTATVAGRKLYQDLKYSRPAQTRLRRTAPSR